MSLVFLYLIFTILLFEFLLERALDYLNSTYWSTDLPKELEGIYDKEKYLKSQNYLKHKQKYSIVLSTITFIVIILILMLGGVARLDNFILGYTVNPILRALIFFGIIGAVSSILLIPFKIYSVFVIEEKYGFNTMNPKTFILDTIKGWLLALMIGGGLLALIVWIYESTGNIFWLITWGVTTLFILFFTIFYSNLIVPLFNKQRVLDPGDLRDAIQSFALRTGFKLKDIYVIDGSKRSTKANAYFTGLGSKKRIVLFDTLIKNHSDEELVAVLAHEIGHYKKKHTLESLFLSIIQTGLMLFILSLFIQKNGMFAQAICGSLGGFSGIEVRQSFHMGALSFAMLYSPLAMILGLFMNMRSRKNEYEADRFAAINQQSECLQSALKKLSVNNLSNLKPHPLYVFFYYSHPPLLQRLSSLKDLSSLSPSTQSQS